VLLLAAGLLALRSLQIQGASGCTSTRTRSTTCAVSTSRCARAALGRIFQNISPCMLQWLSQLAQPARRARVTFGGAIGIAHAQQELPQENGGELADALCVCACGHLSRTCSACCTGQPLTRCLPASKLRSFPGAGVAAPAPAPARLPARVRVRLLSASAIPPAKNADAVRETPDRPRPPRLSKGPRPSSALEVAA